MKNLLFLFFCLLLLPGLSFGQQNHSFIIRDGQFLYDGKPLEIRSGEMHFARIPEPYWRQRLEMLKAMGMNAVATYVFWNYHETAPGVWDFQTGNRNIAEFIRTAQELGLLVILRPGPYACAEWDFGGLPWWLQKNKNLEIRTDNPAYLDSCRIYIDKLAEQVKDLQVTHGGPVIMVQVENEYGSFVEQRQIPLPDAHAYTIALKKDLREAGIDVPLFTADGDWLFKGGYVEGALPAANGEGKIDRLKKTVNEFHGGQGPYMVAEFYPGWLDHWGEPFQQVNTGEVVKQLTAYLDAGVSFNFYMAHGGTNFGFTSGANYDKGHPIQPDITSYDYDAPISEAGWPTPKYFAIRNTIKKYIKDTLPTIPEKIRVITPSAAAIDRSVDLFDIIRSNEPLKGPGPFKGSTPLSFGDLDQDGGYVLYRRVFPESISGTLSIPGLRDYAQVYVNGKMIAVLNRMDSIFTCPIEIPADGRLDIFVENLGRINYGAEMVHNRKGIVGPVRIDNNEITGNWEMYPLPFSYPADLKGFTNSGKTGQPAIYEANFQLTETGDTFLDMQDWGKGIVFVNGHNLGRYWNIGPQQTLYLPGCWLKAGENKVQVFEEMNTTEHTKIVFTSTPVLNDLRKDQGM